VQLTHRNLWLNASVFGWHMGVSDRDVYLHTLPQFHCNGWGMLYATTGMGAQHVIIRKIDGAEILRRVETHGVTLMCGAPAVLNMVLEAAATWEADTGRPVPGRGVVRIVVASAPPPTRTIERSATHPLGARDRPRREKERDRDAPAARAEIEHLRVTATARAIPLERPLDERLRRGPRNQRAGRHLEVAPEEGPAPDEELNRLMPPCPRDETSKPRKLLRRQHAVRLHIETKPLDPEHLCEKDLDHGSRAPDGALAEIRRRPGQQAPDRPFVAGSLGSAAASCSCPLADVLAIRAHAILLI